MELIVAVDKNWGIGLNNELLFHIPEDLKRFKQITLNSVVIMGRKTFESLPNKKPLVSRINIVITRNKDFAKQYDGIVATSLDELDGLLNTYYKGLNHYVIGGDSIYKSLLSKCSMAYVTKVLESKEHDKSFEDLDNNFLWKCVSESRINEYNGIKYKFCTYKNIGNFLIGNWIGGDKIEKDDS